MIDWMKLGQELRQSADAAHEGDTPSVELAYQFLLENPECFLAGDDPEWPAGMPAEPNVRLVNGYYGT